jgi:enduracididine biosynthesis enzyme MppR
MTLNGYTLPMSPSGNASFVPPPPWHFSGEFIWVDYRVDPDRAAAFLPPELTLGPDPGRAAAAFSRWQWRTDRDDELDEPGRCQFAEFMILLAVRHRNRPMARCTHAWVDHSVPLTRGWIQGMPKQFGAVRMTNTVLVGRAGPTLAPDAAYRATLSADDRRVVDARVTLAEPADPPTLNTVPLVHTRVFPSWAPTGTTVHELVCSEVRDTEYSPVWGGTAELTFSPEALAVTPDLSLLAPVDVGRGYVFGYGETLVRGAKLE